MKILHLIVDHQVIERTLRIYEETFPNSNDVIIFSQLPNENNSKHLIAHKNSKRVLLGRGAKEGHIYDFSGYSYIIAHYLTLDMIDFIREAPNNIHITWEIYGWDLYNQFLEPLGFKLSYSDSSKYKKYGFAIKYFPPLFDILLYITGHHVDLAFKRKSSFKYICKRVNAIQYCCLYDAKYVEQYAKRSIYSYEVFNYSLSEVLGDLANSSFLNGNDIMVGNSASYSNNHLYILNYIKKIKLDENSHIIMPLSYGGSQRYIDEVESCYQSIFGGAVKTLRNYLPLHKYNNIFLCLKAMILSAWRQESLGTAIMGFYLGVKVFMSEKSPLYRWFKDCNFIVFTIESITEESLTIGLSQEEKEYNRKMVINHYNNDVFVKTLKSNFK